MKIAIAGFQGEIPILDARLLPDSAAQVARNVFLRRGTLKPYKGLAIASNLPDTIKPANLYRYSQGNNGEGFWFSWGEEYEVHVVRSPIASDPYARVYWTGQGAPKMTSVDIATQGPGPYPSQWFQLGVPAPVDAPFAEPAEGRGEVPDLALETVYVVTVVTRFGEEGPPSDPSNTVMRWDDAEGEPEGGGVVVTLPAIPDADLDIVSKRIYRAESGGEYQLVAEVPASQSTFADNVRSAELGIALPSLYWDAPDPRMIGLTMLPNGIMAGFFDNTLCFSEAYRPHAWPVSYQLAFDEPIVAIASVASGLVVATTGKPWLVTGSSPEAMAQMQLDTPHPCISRRSMVDMGDYAIYASHDGLVAVGGADSQIITANVFTREQWRALKPETIHAYRYDGVYLAFYEGGCFAFTPGQGVQFFDVEASGGYYDVGEGRLYLIQGQSIMAWEHGEPQPYRWRSKVFEMPPGSGSFSCGKVVAYQYPVTLRLFADGRKVFEHDVTGPGMFRLPAGNALARDWEIEIEGSAEVSSVQIASSPTELV